MTYALVDIEAPLRAALERLAESPRELRCFVIVQDIVASRFVQFCTPPPPSKFVGSPRLSSSEPLILDGTGAREASDFESIQEFCDVDRGVALALDILAKYLPEWAQLRIVEESTQMERPS